MCGIAGIISFIDNNNRSLIQQMTDCIAHRGPDQDGIFVKERIALGHRRLSILDLSEKGRQPFTDDEKSIYLSYNGEVYNYQVLRSELEQKYKFKSDTDTEVLVYAYKEWGIDFLQRIEGMFAFILHDFKKDISYVVRDRLGIKPVYYFKDQTGVYLSSEVKSILKVPTYKRAVNPKAISAYLSFRYPVASESFFKDIFLLEPGHYLQIKDGVMSDTTYWDLQQKHMPQRAESFYTKKAARLFEEAVHKRLVADVPLGAYLSGGLDSSAIVALMAKKIGKRVQTFSIGFDDKKTNEFEYARLVAQRYDLDHHEILLDPSEYMGTVEELITFKDAPLGVPNEVPLYLMSKELKKHITVVLSGEGSDEIFSGYGRLYRSPSDYRKLALMKNPFMPLLLPGLSKRLQEKYGSSDFADELAHFLYLYNYFPFDEKFGLFTDRYRKEIDDDGQLIALFRSTFERYNGDYYAKIPFVFEKLHLPGLLQRADCCTMSVAVEARVPFVDHKLVEFMVNVPSEYKMKWRSLPHFLRSLSKTSDMISEVHDSTKHILREITKDNLPSEIIERKKVGFPVPLQQWVGGELEKYVKKYLASAGAKVYQYLDQQKVGEWIRESSGQNHGQKLWMIINLEIFLQKYF